MSGLNIVWRVYLVIWMLFRVFTLGTRLLFDLGLQSAAYLTICVVSFIPLVGFIRERPTAAPLFWRVWLLFLLGWALIDRTFYEGWFLQPPFDGELVGLLAAGPSFAAIYSHSRGAFSARR